MTDRVRLSHKVIDGIPIPASGRTHVYDAMTPGLAVCTTPTGRKLFYWLGRVAGHPTRIKIGGYPEMTLDAARREAKQIAGDAASGNIPRTRRKRASQEATLLRAFNHFMDHVSRPHKRTWERDIRQFDRTLAEWKHLPLSRIKKAMVMEKHVAIGDDKGPYAANKMLELLKTIYRHAINQLEWTGANPTLGVAKFSVQSRDRFLEASELPKFFEGVSKLKREASRDFFLLCLFTGARRMNVCAMRWSDVDMNRRVWRVPHSESKNKKPLDIVLPPEAMEILKRRESTARNDWVLPGQGTTGHFIEPKAAWAEVLKHAGLSDLRIHDLRRTLGSWQAMNGSSLTIIGRSLGHTSLAATSVYARLQTDPVRESVEGATAAMLAAAQRKSESENNSESISRDATAVSGAIPVVPVKHSKKPKT